MIQEYKSSSEEEEIEEIDVVSLDDSKLEREMNGLLVSTFRRVVVSLKLMKFYE